MEAVRVAYDDELVSYEKVLDYFYEDQKPGNGRQYASVIFTNDGTEEKEAKQWKKESTSKSTSYNIVDIEPSSAFYRAEEYHQRYWEKQRLRFLFGFALIAGESGAYNNILGGALGSVEVFGQTFDTICGGLFLAGAGLMLVERGFAKDVRELEEGDLAKTIG